MSLPSLQRCMTLQAFTRAEDHEPSSRRRLCPATAVTASAHSAPVDHVSGEYNEPSGAPLYQDRFPSGGGSCEQAFPDSGVNKLSRLPKAVSVLFLEVDSKTMHSTCRWPSATPLRIYGTPNWSLKYGSRPDGLTGCRRLFTGRVGVLFTLTARIKYCEPTRLEAFK